MPIPLSRRPAPSPSARALPFLPLAGVLLLTLVPGCEWKGGVFSDAPADTQPAPAWNATPQALRIYPATRILADSAKPVVEARIEFLDALDDACKATGTIRFELRSASAGHQTSITNRLYAWDVSIRTLEEQKRYYDPVTRTYFFRLSLDELSQLPPKVTLHAHYKPEDGSRIEANATLNVPRLVE